MLALVKQIESKIGPSAAYAARNYVHRISDLNDEEKEDVKETEKINQAKPANNAQGVSEA